MSVYVDPISPCIRGKRWPYNEACHLIADSINELHEFALWLGLKRLWFQDKTIPHYDLTKGMRRKAVVLGAIEIDVKTFVRKMRELQ